MSTEQSRIRRAVDSDRLSKAIDWAAVVGRACLVGAAFGIYAAFIVISNEVLVSAGVPADADAVRAIVWSLQVPLFASVSYAASYQFNVYSDTNHIDTTRATLAFTGVVSGASFIRLVLEVL